MTDFSRTVLQTRGLEKSFRSGTRDIRVLQGCDLTVRGGESVSVRGPSGSGKTTLLNLIAGLEAPDTGRILWDEEEVTGIRLGALAARRSGFVGMVFQAYHLIPELTAYENVLLPARIRGGVGSQERSRARSATNPR